MDFFFGLAMQHAAEALDRMQAELDKLQLYMEDDFAAYLEWTGWLSEELDDDA